MTKNNSAVIKCMLAVVLVCGLLSACSSDKKKPLTGERISVLQFQDESKADASVQDMGVELSAVTENSEWAQSDLNAAHRPENLSLTDGELKRVWSENIGQGSEKDAKLITVPVSGEGKVFISNTEGEVVAVDVQSGKELWKVNILPDDENSTVSAGLAYADGTLYVTDGIGHLLKLDAKTGKNIWSQELEQPVRGAPTVHNGHVYMITLGDETLDVDANTGAMIWRHTGVEESAGLLGAPSPAVQDSVVITAYSSGDVVALRAETGQEAWSDNLTGVAEFQSRAVTQLSGFRGDPVLEGDVAFIGNSSTRLVAIHIPSGERIWQKEFGVMSTPLVSGNMVFVVTSQNELMALVKETGKVRWAINLPRYEDPADKEDVIFWNGPVLGGGRLFVTGSNEKMLEIDPQSGKTLRKIDLPDRVMLPPIIVQKTLIVITDDGSLVAYR